MKMTVQMINSWNVNYTQLRTSSNAHMPLILCKQLNYDTQNIFYKQEKRASYLILRQEAFINYK